MVFPINTVIFLLFIALVIFLQFKLSKSQSKWPGFILPFISFAFSIITVLNMVIYTESYTTSVDGQVITEIISTASIGEIILQGLLIFVVSNIPTAILLGIYAYCRDQLKKRSELDKMKIQDL